MRKCKGTLAEMKGREGKSWEIRLSKWVRVADQVKTRSYKAFGLFLQARVATESV